MNERIRAREVRLIDENGAQLGIMATREALRVARERELDLIEVAPNAQPPVCRIMDYGKHKYQQAKREREAHKRSKPTEVRLLRLKPQIGPHDLEIKLRKLRELLGDGNKVRINLRFRGREVSHPELGSRLLNQVAEHLADVALTRDAPSVRGSHDEYDVGAEASCQASRPGEAQRSPQGGPGRGGSGRPHPTSKGGAGCPSASPAKTSRATAPPK